MKKKPPLPKFVCYDKNTPFRSEGTVIYGPKVLPSISDPEGKPAPTHYECFICDCDNEVAADALVTILNEAWLAGKILGETNNPNQKQEPNPEPQEKDNRPSAEDLKKFYSRMKEQRKREDNKTESGQKFIRDQEEALREFLKLQNKAIEIEKQKKIKPYILEPSQDKDKLPSGYEEVSKTPGWFEQKWDD